MTGITVSVEAVRELLGHASVDYGIGEDSEFAQHDRMIAKSEANAYAWAIAVLLTGENGGQKSSAVYVSAKTQMRAIWLSGRKATGDNAESVINAARLANALI